MRILLLALILLVRRNGFSQQLSKFDSAYVKLMHLAKRWEAMPTNAKVIKHNFFSPRFLLRLKVKYDSNAVSYVKKIYTHYTKAGVCFERIKVSSNGKLICKIRKVNNHYITVSITTGIKNLTQYIINEKYIVAKSLAGASKDSFGKEYLFTKDAYFIKK
jgi:hypothetical protein